MAVSRLKLANPQPLVTLKYNFYQDSFMQARRQRFCPEGHIWSRLEHEHCPLCQELFNRQEQGNRAYKRFLLRAGRRGGKTRIGALAAIEEATIPGSVGWCCAPTYPELEDFVLPAFFKQIPQAWLDHPLTDWSESEYTLLLPNRAIVQFRSLEDPDRGRGPGLHWLWIDEICKLSRRHWETIRPTLTEHKGILIGTTTPKGEDWVHEDFYEPAERGKPGYWACVYRTVDNPIIDAAEVLEAKESMTPEMYQQEYEADIVTFTGAIFGDHVPPCLIEGTDEQMKYYFPEWPNLDPGRPCVMGIDPGTDHPFGAGKWVASPHGLVKVGEYMDRGRPFAIHAQHVQTLKGTAQCRIAIDRSAAQAQIELAQYGLYTVQADNDVVAGINRMLSWMIASKNSVQRGGPGTLPSGMVLPRRLVPKTIKQYQSYRWADNEKKDGSTKHRELVHKKNDDLIDPDRYALMLYPHLPTDQPGVDVGKRDLSGMPEYYKAQIERMRRVDSDADKGDEVPMALEYQADAAEAFGMGDFNQ